MTVEIPAMDFRILDGLRAGTDWWCNQRMLGTRRATPAAA